jgi:hypothetical protein
VSQEKPGRRTVRRGQPSVFLERESYRRRRLMDAARLLPILGALLFMLPLLWPDPDPGEATNGIAMSSAMIYVFAVWIGLIGAIFLFGKATRPGSRRVDGQGMG